MMELLNLVDEGLGAVAIYLVVRLDQRVKKLEAKHFGGRSDRPG